MHVLVIGCGYVGARYAQQAIDRGWTVTALTRSSERAAAWQQAGLHTVVGDVLDPDSLKALPEADLCLYAVGFDRHSSASKRDVYVQGLHNVLREISLRVPRLIYVSSTSVYGESSGGWVNEETECLPATDSGKICLAAEEIVSQFYPSRSNMHQSTILRLSGIYGPQRLIGRQEQLRHQQPIAGHPQAWLNLIHVADILQALFKLSEAPPPSARYLLSDERPNPRIEFYSELARHLNAPPPVMPDPPSQDLGKRCDSSRIRIELNLTLLHPTIQSGIPACLEDEPSLML